MAADCVNDLMWGYTHYYDQCVDVVSIFEMLYTQSDTKLPGTVAHFERFPRIGGFNPDFTVAFHDGTGLVGEIANVPREERGIDRTCRQLANYDQLTELPIDSAGTLREVDQVDVLFLTPDVDAPGVASNILSRAADEDHDYSPSHPPFIVGYYLDKSPDGLRYVVKDSGHERNGHLREDRRPDGIGAWLAEGRIKVPPQKFEDVKAASVFMNDPPKRLYMATALWARVIPTLATTKPRRPEPIDITEKELAAVVRERYGRIRESKRAVREALEMLEKAKYAFRLSTDGAWRLAWEQPNGRSSESLAQQFAERFCKPGKRGAVDRLPKPKKPTDDGPIQLRLDT